MRCQWSNTRKPCTVSLFTRIVRHAFAIGADSPPPYQAIIPQTAILPPCAMSGSTASTSGPPTFSK